MRREKKIEYAARIAYSWRDLIFNIKDESKGYDYLFKVMVYMYQGIRPSFIHKVYLDTVKRDPIYGMWDDETNIMLCYETEHKKYGVYCVEYILDCWECTELVGKYSSRRMAERVASILNEMYDDSYIVEQL